MTWPGAAGRLRVQYREISRLRIDGECTHGPSFLVAELIHLDNRVENLSVRMHGEISRVCRLRRKTDAGELAVVAHAPRINATALRARVSAEINKVVRAREADDGEQSNDEPGESSERFHNDLDASIHYGTSQPVQGDSGTRSSPAFDHASRNATSGLVGWAVSEISPRPIS